MGGCFDGSSLPPMLGEPSVGEFYQGFSYAFVGDLVEGFADEGCDQEGLGLGFGDAAGHEVEEVVVVEVA